jgi:hypothetical protein
MPSNRSIKRPSQIKSQGELTHASVMHGRVSGRHCLPAEVTHLLGQQVCKPNLAFKEVNFSEMQPPTLKRTWTAVVSVDTAGCAVNSRGHFEIVFSRLKEIGPEIEFREQFKWLPPSVNVAVDFWADEAVESYRIDSVSPCSCIH